MAAPPGTTSRPAGGDGTTGLTSSPGGTSHTFVWASNSDIVNVNDANVMVRITPTAATVGTPGTSGVFSVDNFATDWVAVGVGDFTGNGTSDILWQNMSTGEVDAWIIQNGAYSSRVILGQADPSVWKVAGVGDFMGNGTADVLWYNQSTGDVGAWIIKNGASTGWADLGTADPTVWKVAGVGDFTGGGTADVLWYNQSTGNVGAWIIKNGVSTAWAALGTADPTVWTVAGIGDFNGDGTADVLWYNQSTQSVGAWIIKNGASTGWADMGTADPTVWKVAGVGDFTGDGTADVLWYNQSTGIVGAWIIKNGVSTAWATLGTADPTVWTVAGVGDFNGDGTADVLWCNKSNGDVGAWIIKNGASTGWAGLGVLSPAAASVTGAVSPSPGVASSQAVGVAALLQSGLQPMVAEAAARWTAAGLDVSASGNLAPLQSVVDGLPGARGEVPAAADRLYTADNATDRGSLIPPASALGEEIAWSQTDRQLLVVDPRAVDRIDLATVVEHELGDVAGFDDLDALAGGALGRAPDAGFAAAGDGPWAFLA